MTEMQLPIIITKKECERCKNLKEWLKANKIDYIEKPIEDQELVEQLKKDENFLHTFCNEEECIIKTPVVLFKGKYWFKELWGIDGLRKKEAEKLFKGKE